MATPRDLSASTINNWLTKSGVIDAAYKTRPILDELRSTGSRQGKRGVPQQKSAFRTLDGGEYIQDAPILNPSAGPTNITGDEVLTGTGHDPLEKALWYWCFKGDIVQINEVDDLKNSGNSSMVDEWQTRITEKMNAMFQSVEYDMAARSSLTGASSYWGVNGLPSLIPTTATSDTTAIAGITRANTTIPGWCSQGTTSVGSFTNYYGTLNTYRAICEGNSGTGWNLILTTPTVWALMATKLQSLGQVELQNDKDPDIGYRYFTWLGAKVCMDPNITAGYIYGMCTEDMFFAVHSKANFLMTDEYEASNQFIKARKLRFMGNLGFRRFWGAAVTTGWT